MEYCEQGAIETIEKGMEECLEQWVLEERLYCRIGREVIEVADCVEGEPLELHERQQ